MKKYLCLIGLLFCFTNFALGQKFELVDESEYKEYYKKPIFVPDARLSGEYQYHNHNIGDASGNRAFVFQNFRLKIVSEVNENIKFHLGVTNNYYDWGEQKDPYQSYDLNQTNSDRQTKISNRSRQNIGIAIQELFLEYNPNPNAIIRLGRQSINLGDKLGLIYKGEVDAITITCRIGTWCLELGQANLGKESNRATWLQFFYPVYESATSLENYWISEDRKTRKTASLEIDFYRILDRQDNLALAKYGGRTFNPFINNQDKIVHSAEQFKYKGEYVIFNRNQDTYGINLKWHQNNFGLFFNAIQNSGKKEYFLENEDSAIAEAESNVTGNLYRLEWQQLVGKTSQFGFTGLVSSGKPAGDNTGDNLPWRSGFDYHEWNRGTYGDALIYFNKNYGGDAHSVNNLIYFSFYYKYNDFENDFGVTTQLFSFSRNEAVLSQAETKVKNIALEVDLTIYKYLAKSLKVSLDAAYLVPDAAYSPSDSIMPTGVDNKKSITHYSIGINYKF